MANPTLTSFSPASIPGVAGTVTTITGLNFSSNGGPVSAVTVNGAAATFVITNDTTLAVTIPNAAAGLASVAVTNTSGTTTNTTGLTITAYTIPTNLNNQANFTGVFDTSGTAIGQTLDAAYGRLSAVFGTTDVRGKYRLYLEKTAKIAAVVLYNTRYNPDLSVPTY